MDTHPQARVVGKACSGYMHSNCQDEECGCNCHQVCSRCGAKCQATYDASEVIGEEHLVCAECYVLLTAKRRRARCEGDDCSATAAYRDPKLGNFYLCMDCHHERALASVSPLAS
jgi:hypothetical protein